MVWKGGGGGKSDKELISTISQLRSHDLKRKRLVKTTSAELDVEMRWRIHLFFHPPLHHFPYSSSFFKRQFPSSEVKNAGETRFSAVGTLVKPTFQKVRLNFIQFNRTFYRHVFVVELQ